MKKSVRIAIFGLAALGLVAAAACGGSSSPSPAGSVRVKMTEFKLSPAVIDASAGKAALMVENDGTIAHDVVVQDASGKVVAKSELLQAGGSSVLKLEELPAGTYTISCDVPGHRTSGMLGSLTIT